MRSTDGLSSADAAGTATLKALHASGVDVELFTRTGEQPSNWTRANKGVAPPAREP